MQITLQTSAAIPSFEFKKRRIQKSIIEGFEINTPLIIASLLIFVALITIITLFFAGKQVTKGYTIKQLEAERQTLQRDNEIIGSRLAELQAMQQVFITRKARNMHAAPSDKITFIRGDSNLAQR